MSTILTDACDVTLLETGGHMFISDDRTEQDKTDHPILVVATDRFMSGWGGAHNGASYAAWACRHDDQYKVERWVRSRPEMLRVRVALSDYRPNPAYCAHLHVYVVREGHPALH